MLREREAGSRFHNDTRHFTPPDCPGLHCSVSVESRSNYRGSCEAPEVFCYYIRATSLDGNVISLVLSSLKAKTKS